MSPAVKPEAESAPRKSQRAQHPPRPRPASPGRDRPGVTGRRAHGRPPREPGMSGGHGGLRACTLGTCSRAPGDGTGARRGGCGSAADTAPALAQAGSCGLLHTRALPPGTWAPRGRDRRPWPLQSPGSPVHTARHRGTRAQAHRRGVGVASGAAGGARGRPARQRRGAYDEGGAEQLKAGCEV